MKTLNEILYPKTSRVIRNANIKTWSRGDGKQVHDRLAPAIQSIHDSIKDHYNNHIDQVAKQDPEILNHLREYTHGSYGINNWLHNYYNSFAPSVLGEKHKVHSLDAITHDVKAPRSFHVYSGMSNPMEDWRSGVIPRKEVHDDEFHHCHLPAFTSTSLDPRVAGAHMNFRYHKGNVGHILKIHIPKGSEHGAYVSGHAVENYDYFPEGEKHFILKRGTNIAIHKVPEKHVDIEGRPIHVWHAKITEHNTMLS